MKFAHLKKYWRLALPIVVLWMMFGVLMYNAWAQSPTMDEQNHIARGYALLRTGDPRLSIEHPPLVNLLEALPLLLLRELPNLPLDTEAWATGYWYRFAELFLWEVNAQPDRIVFLARLPVVAMTLCLAALAARWARELWGTGAGLVALCLVAFDPNILAHGSLATTDLGVTLMALLAAYAVWHLAQSPGRPLRFLGAGLALGAMLASKTSALMFLGVFGLLFVGLALWEGPKRFAWRRVLLRSIAYVGLTVVALLVLWACYMFEFVPVVEGGLVVPLGTYGKGILAVLRNVQGGQPAYLLGKTTLGGTPAYFPIAFAVKTPLPILLILLLAVPVAIRQKHWPEAVFLLTPVACYAFFALCSSLNLGYRHLLPILPFLYVWAAQLRLPTFDKFANCAWLEKFQRIGSVLVLWLLVETLWIAPHFLAYFNPVAGGPAYGWRVIADSNIDWGQDLKYLRDYVTHEQLQNIKLSWFGSAPPAAYGIVYEPLPGLPHHFNMWFEPPTFNEQQPEPGTYVISVSNLVELPLDKKHFFDAFRAREPDARIGYSVYVYKVEAP